MPWSWLLLLSGISHQSFPEGSFRRGRAWHGLRASWQHPPALPFQAGDFPAGMKPVGAVGPAATPCSWEMPPLPKPPGQGCCPVWTSGLQAAGLLLVCTVVLCGVFSTLRAPGTPKPPGCWGSGALPAPTAPRQLRFPLPQHQLVLASTGPGPQRRDCEMRHEIRQAKGERH